MHPKRDVAVAELVERVVGGEDRVQSPLAEKLPERAGRLEILEIANDRPVVEPGIAEVELCEPVSVGLAAQHPSDSRDAVPKAHAVRLA